MSDKVCEGYECVHGLNGRSASVGAARTTGTRPPFLLFIMFARVSRCKLPYACAYPAEGESRAGGVGQDSEKRQGQEGGGRGLGQ